MAIMMGNKPVIAFKGDHEPVNMAKGNTKVTGWRRELLSGTELSFYNTYKDSVSLSIEGNTKVSDEVYREKTGNTVVVPADEHAKASADKVLISGNTVQMSDWYGVDGESSQYQDTKPSTVNIIDVENLDGTEYLGSGSFRASSWAQSILSNVKVLTTFKPSTTYYFKVKYTLETLSGLPVYQKKVGFNLYSSATGSINFGDSIALDVIGKTAEVSGSFTTPSSLGDKQLLFYSNRYTDGTTVELDTVKVEKFIISEVNAPYEPYKDTVKNGLVLEYNGKNFFNTPQTTSLKDRSGNGNHGTPSGFAYNSTSGSDGNGGIVFDGVDDRIYCVASDDLKTMSDFTMEAVFRHNTDTNNTHRGIISPDISSNAFYISNARKLRFIVRGGSYVDSEQIVADDTDHSVVVVKSGNDLIYYIDGVVDSVHVGFFEGIDTSFTGATIFNIGYRDADRYFDGVIYSARIYNRALSESEIYQNYMAGTSLNMPSPEDPSPVVSNLPAGTYKYTSTDGVYEFTLDEELNGCDVGSDKVVFDRITKRGHLHKVVGTHFINPTNTKWNDWKDTTKRVTFATSPSRKTGYNSLGFFSHGTVINNGMGNINTIGVYELNDSTYWYPDWTKMGLVGDELKDIADAKLLDWVVNNSPYLTYILKIPVKTPLTFTKVSSSTAPEVPMQFITSEISPDYPAEMYDINGNRIISRTKNMSPPFNEWTLEGGAYVSEGELFLPNMSSKATVMMEWNGSEKLSFRGMFTAQPLLNTEYYDKDMVLVGSNGWTGSYQYPIYTGSALPYSILNMGEWLDRIRYIKLRFSRTSSTSPNAYSVSKFSVSDIVIPENEYSGVYNFQSTATPILRKVGTVADTYNPLTGEYIKRVGVKVFDGSEVWSERTSEIILNNVNWYQTKVTPLCVTGVGIASHFSIVNSTTSDYEHIRVLSYGGSFYLGVFINKSRVKSLDDFKSYLSTEETGNSPFTIYYQLATPIVTYLEPNLVPLYDVDTYIESDSAIAQPNITVGYELKDGVTTNINDITEPHPDYPRVIDGVGEYDEVNDDYNLEVYSGAGRNLLRNGDILKSGSSIIVYPLDLELFRTLEGETVTMSADVFDDYDGVHTFDLYLRNQNGAIGGMSSRMYANSERKRFYYTTVVPDLSSSTRLDFYIRTNYYIDPNNTGVCSAVNAKVERGTQATPWTPAPEDIQYNTPTNNTFKTLHNFPIEMNRVGDIADEYTPPFWGAGYDGDGRNLIYNTVFSGVSNKYIHDNVTGEGGFRYYYDKGHMFLKPKQGEKYTISMRVRGDCNIGLYMVSPLENKRLSWISKTQLSETEYRDFSLTFTPHQPELTEVFICTDYRRVPYTEWFEIEPCTLKLERGSSPTPWTPSSGEFVQRIGKKVFDGSEAWSLNSSFNNAFYLGDIVPYNTPKTCSHFPYTSLDFKVANVNTVCENTVNNSMLIVNLPKGNIDTISNFKTWLETESSKGRPVTLYYILNTPVLSTITGSAIPTFYPHTKVETLTAGTKPKISGTARVIDLLESDF